MSYVGAPFEHDLFVSYSHGSDARGDPVLRGWSLKLVETLEEEMRVPRDFRDTLSLFVDRGLDRMAPLTDQLDARASAAALLLVLLTPDYQASRWCRSEREWWLAAQARLHLPPEGRVALVRALPVPREWPILLDGAPGPEGSAWPVPLADRAGEPLVGYPFHSGQGLRARPLGWAQWQAGFGPEVREQIINLAAELGQKLAALKAELDRRRSALADADRLAGGAARTLYLHGRADQALHWERAANELLASGFAVLPGEPDPLERDPARQEEIRQQRVTTLTECDALVLVGSEDGRTIDQDMIVVGKHDRQSARSRSDRLLPCALLDLVGARVATPVRRQTARIVQTDWLDATREPPGAVVRQWLVEKSRQAGQA